MNDDRRWIRSLPSALPLGVMVGLTSSALAQGGDGPDAPTSIASLPFEATGSTSDLTDQWDEVCPFTGSTSPDAWYAFTPDADMLINIRLCDSGYDTKVYVLDADLTSVGCNDDSCSSPAGGAFRSFLTFVPVSAGQSYFIVVDGWSGAAGDYVIEVTQAGDVSCPVTVPSDALAEIEPCHGGTEPETTGCVGDDDQVVLVDATPSVPITGTLWRTSNELDGLDRDGWRLPPAGYPGTWSFTATAELDLTVFLYPESTCDALVLPELFAVERCGTTTDSISLDSLRPTFWFMTPDEIRPPCNDGSSRYVLEWSLEPETDCAPAGDLDLDGAVAFPDLLTLLSNFDGEGLGDLNLDGRVAFGDLLSLISDFGPCP